MKKQWSQYVGVDGCRSGWVAFALQTDRQAGFHFAETLAGLQAQIGGGYWLVDMPMGLPDLLSPVRKCEALARRALTGQGSSVFQVMPREIYRDHDSYAGALQAARTALGKGFSKQSWFLRKKILEADGWIQHQRETTDFIALESHPEIVFRQLNNGPLTHKKRTAEGFAERSAVLEKQLPQATALLHEAITRHKGKAQPDDWADALALAAYGRHKKGQLSPHPDPVELDERGLPMAIWW